MRTDAHAGQGVLEMVGSVRNCLRVLMVLVMRQVADGGGGIAGCRGLAGVVGAAAQGGVLERFWLHG